MIDSVEDCWDTAYIMAEGELKAKINSGDGNESLEELFFSVTDKESAAK